MLALTIEGTYEGRHVVLWASMVSGLEIISVDGREVSRERKFGFSTVHDLSSAGIGIEVGVVKGFPLRLELHKGDATLATFTHPYGRLILILVVIMSVLAGMSFAALTGLRP
jgi:hypothetical protein